ncbi:hypothetical protein [Fusobacterium sp. PH5-44]|uniref:hypothetical protein n=1 Tax=unclassified Fusobacterium TaxID=2648384 RepID=UPI003D210EB1
MKNQRVMRAAKLIKLGLSCEITGVIEFGQEIVLGHLLDFKKNFNPLMIENGNLLLNKIQSFDQRKVSQIDHIDKRKRNHDLIIFGALFEISNLDDKKLSVLIGYLEDLKVKNNSYINNCDLAGKTYFLQTKQQKKKLLYWSD